VRRCSARGKDALNVVSRRARFFHHLFDKIRLDIRSVRQRTLKQRAPDEAPPHVVAQNIEGIGARSGGAAMHPGVGCHVEHLRCRLLRPPRTWALRQKASRV
jgi:hypothetical protein